MEGAFGKGKTNFDLSSMDGVESIGKMFDSLAKITASGQDEGGGF